MVGKSFPVVYFKLFLEILFEIGFLFESYVFIAHLLKSMNKCVFKCSFALGGHKDDGSLRWWIEDARAKVVKSRELTALSAKIFMMRIDTPGRSGEAAPPTMSPDVARRLCSAAASAAYVMRLLQPRSGFNIAPSGL